MKTTTFFATVASLCCGLSSLFGQSATSGILNLDAPAPAASQLESANGAPGTTHEIANPFSFFSDDPPAVEPRQSADSGRSASDRDPSSLSPRDDRHKPTLIDTMANHALLANIPHAAHSHDCWYGPCATPNPVAEVLLRQECVDGLWAGYQAQRAAECAKMWHHLAGRPAPCYSVCGPCSACSPQPPRNRYLEQHGPACDTPSCGHHVPSPASHAIPTPVPLSALPSPTIAPPIGQSEPSSSQSDSVAWHTNSMLR